MKLRQMICAVTITTTLVTGAVPFVATPVGAVNIGQEGCTPGYWKNHTENWEEYATSTTLRQMLGGYDFPSSLDAYESTTMLQALSFHGGTGVTGAARILLRAATAAYLNAAHEGVGYPYRRTADPFNIQAKVRAALGSLNRQQMLDLAATLDRANNLGCPLS